MGQDANEVTQPEGPGGPSEASDASQSDDSSTAPSEPSQSPGAVGPEAEPPAASELTPSDGTAQAGATAAPAQPTQGPEPATAASGSEAEGAPAPDAVAADPAAGQPAADGEAAAQEPGAEAKPEGAGKKRRRRRRKKKDGSATSPGEEGAVEAESGDKPKPKRETHAPFAKLFAAHAGKRHAFSVGEVVAGRVVKVEGGAFVVDLFGKATAVVDELEPRTPPAEEPRPAVEPTEGAAAQAADSAQGEPDTAPVEAVAPQAEPAAATPAEGQGEAAASQAPQGEAGATLAADAAGAPAASAGAELSAEPAPATQQAGLSEAEPEVDAGQGPAAEAGDQGLPTPQSAEAAPVEATADAPASDDAGDPATVAQAPPADAAAGAEAVEGGAAPSGQEGAEQEELDATSPGSADAPKVPHRPLPPAPVVPEELRAEAPPETGQIWKGRVGAVSESGHIALVNRLVDTAAVRTEIEEWRKLRRRVQGLIYGYNRGGFDVLVAGIRAFCPASAMALGEIGDPNAYVGQRLEFQLPASKASSKDLVVSRRSILEREQRKKAKELLRSLAAGQEHEGRVTSVREFGLFVDIGGIEGLVHQSEISFAHGVKPSEVAKPGEVVRVQVLRVGADPAKKEGGKKDKGTRVSLSMKALLPDPWKEHAETLKEGSVQKGKVTRTTDFGAFIELAPTIEGLLHISELGRELKHANLAVKEGEELYVVVERVDRKARRISLSKLTDAEIQEFEAGGLVDAERAPKSLRPGSKIKVKVDRIEHRGIVVRVDGVVGKRARGFIPNSETGTERGTDLRKLYAPGQEVEIKVVGLDRDGGLRCSLKALQIDEERRAVKDYRREAAKQGFGTFGDLLKAKLGGPAGDSTTK